MTSTPGQRRGDALGVGGVRHDVELVVADPPDDDVVNDEAVVGQEVRVLRATRSDLVEVVRQRVLQRLEHVGPVTAHRAEVADVKDHGVVATREVLGDRARRVLQRHLPAAEGDDLRAQFDVKIVEIRTAVGHGLLRRLDRPRYRDRADAESRGSRAGRRRGEGSRDRARGSWRTLRFFFVTSR